MNENKNDLSIVYHAIFAFRRLDLITFKNSMHRFAILMQIDPEDDPLSYMDYATTKEKEEEDKEDKEDKEKEEKEEDGSPALLEKEECNWEKKSKFVYLYLYFITSRIFLSSFIHCKSFVPLHSPLQRICSKSRATSNQIWKRNY